MAATAAGDRPPDAQKAPARVVEAVPATTAKAPAIAPPHPSLAARPELAPGIPDPGPLPACAALPEPRNVGCEVRARRLQVVTRDAWLAQANAELAQEHAARLAAERGARGRAGAAWTLAVVGTAALATGLVVLADGNRSLGAGIALGGAAVGTAGLVVARF